MKLFGKKQAGSAHDQRAASASDDRQPTHRLTLDLSRTFDMAAMIARSRASQFIEISDFLAGLYLYEWERICEYWPEERRDQVEEILREICQISPERWNYWIQLYDKRRRGSEPQSHWEKWIKPKPDLPQTAVPSPSGSMRKVLATAEGLTPFRDSKPKSAHEESIAYFDRGIPVLTTESVLLSITKYTASDSGRKLVASGLDIDMLERATLDPKRSPLR